MSRQREDLERRLREARPDGNDVDRLTPHDREVLARIMSANEPDLAAVTPLEAARRRRSRVPVLAAAVVIAVVLVVAVVGRPRLAYAATPPPLVATAIPQTPGEVLQTAADSVPADRSAGSRVRFHMWALDSEYDEAGNLVSHVDPYLVTLDYGPDGTVTVTRLTDTPWSGDVPGAPPAGQLVSRDVYPPGKFQAVFTKPPSTPEAFGPYLRKSAFLPDKATAGDYIQGAMALLNERPLSGAQESALLRFLAGLPDLTVNGKVVDRLGRPGIQLSATTAGAADILQSIIVSTDGQGILSVEATYVGHQRTDIPSPSVTLYNAWER